ncbi:MAG: hypothetical protein ACI9FR_001247 [Cryomorphaceae bacterium]|jgi:hypothetical protein
MKKIFLIISIAFLSACGGGDSSSGAAVDPTTAGTMIPANFVGTYIGTLNLEASALGITESDSFAITITVTADGMLRFDGDEPDETVTVGVTNAGDFSASLSITEDPCTGTINLVGTVDGTTASGTVSGEGTCSEGGLTVDAELSGNFSASK